MNPACPIVLISISAIFLIQGLFFKFGGFPLALKFGLPTTLGMMTLNQSIEVWLESPIPMAIVSKIRSASPIPATDGNVGGGILELELTMAKWEDDDDVVREVLMVQEDSELDQIQHYSVILSKFAWSSWNLICWMLLLTGVIALVIGIVWMVISNGAVLKRLKNTMQN